MAVQTARNGRADWEARPARDRAAALVAAAAWMRDRRLELAALEVRECAKPWPEADADVCEAIDFLEYYARGAIELDAGAELLQVPGERNEMRYVPRGVAAVIAPWNFPIAIVCGMTAAAIATGDGVVVKPAEQSPGCALQVVQALGPAGVPGDALSLLPARATSAPRWCAIPTCRRSRSPDRSPVGLEIIRSAADTVPASDTSSRS